MSKQLYTYVPEDNTVDVDGILSTALAEKGWEKYKQRSGKNTKEEVLHWLDSLDPGFRRSLAVTVLTEPVDLDNAHPDFIAFHKAKKLYQIASLDKLIKSGIVKCLRSINVGGSGTHKVTRPSHKKIQWQSKTPGKFLFSNVPHYLLETTTGRIPPEYVFPVDRTERAKHILKQISELADRADMPVFAVTDGASITRNNGNAAVKHARDSHVAWERENDIDPHHDWGVDKKATNDSDIYALLEADAVKSDIPIKIVPNHDHEGTAFMHDVKPYVVLRKPDYKVLAHELGHIKDSNSIAKKLIDTIGGIGNGLKSQWLINKAIRWKEQRANNKALELLKQYGVSARTLKDIEDQYTAYINSLN